MIGRTVPMIPIFRNKKMKSIEEGLATFEESAITPGGGLAASLELPSFTLYEVNVVAPQTFSALLAIGLKEMSCTYCTFYT